MEKVIAVLGLFISQIALAAIIGGTVNDNGQTSTDNLVAAPPVVVPIILAPMPITQSPYANSDTPHVISQGAELSLEGSVNTQSQADQLLDQTKAANPGKSVIDNLSVENISQ